MKDIIEYIVGGIGLLFLESFPIAISSAWTLLLILAIGVFCLYKVNSIDKRTVSDK